MVKNKTTSKPTARWVFLIFEGIDTLELGGQSFITGVKKHQTRLLKLLGVLYEAEFLNWLRNLGSNRRLAAFSETIDKTSEVRYRTFP
ncbi:hypothetical protein CAY62_20155 (plasmid) [Photobacterium damselae subsp. damselae]|nr:hypothetical protein CAY62_20155 [Photobacterium damselae subsp. damselae]